MVANYHDTVPGAQFVLSRRVMGSSMEAPDAAASRRDGRPRRPWYLVVVLVLAWLTGASSVMGGCQTIEFYRSTTLEIAQPLEHEVGKTETELAETHAHFATYTAALDRDRSREFPLAVAALLVGAAMVVFAQRAMIGREWARALLVQLTLAHAALVVLQYVLTPRIQRATVELGAFLSGVDATLMARLVVVGTGISVMANMLIVLGLTRQRSRAFYLT
jgi:hypothetical protein